MKSSYSAAVLALLLALGATAFKSTNVNQLSPKYTKSSFELSLSMQEFQSNFRKSIVSLALLPLVLAAGSTVAHADDTKDVQSYYWGVGCFWHTQHEFIGAEQRLLGRTDEQLTVRG